MNASGWFVMILSCGFVTWLTAWSITRVLSESKADKLHSQVDIEPKDKEE